MESQRRIELIEHAPADVREQALSLLDEVSRPLTPRELEDQLVRYYTRAKAREIVKALNFFKVVLLQPLPQAPEKYHRTRPLYEPTTPHGRRGRGRQGSRR